MTAITLTRYLPGIDEHPHYRQFEEMFQRAVAATRAEVEVEVEQSIRPGLDAQTEKRVREAKFKTLFRQKIAAVVDCVKENAARMMEKDSAAEEERKQEFTQAVATNADIKQYMNGLVDERMAQNLRAGQKISKGEAIGQLRAEGALPPKEATVDERQAWYQQQTSPEPTEQAPEEVGVQPEPDMAMAR